MGEPLDELKPPPALGEFAEWGGSALLGEGVTLVADRDAERPAEDGYQDDGGGVRPCRQALTISSASASSASRIRSASHPARAMASRNDCRAKVREGELRLGLHTGNLPAV